MKANWLVISDIAATDILEQADWYGSQSGASLAARWEKAVTSAILKVVETPMSGTACTFASSELRDIRRTTITGFPKHLIFYRFSQGKSLFFESFTGSRSGTTASGLGSTSWITHYNLPHGCSPWINP